MKVTMLRPLMPNAFSRCGLLTVLILMGIVNYLQTSFNTFHDDDWMYQYMCSHISSDIHFDHSKRIDNITDAIASMRNWYFLENGRLMVHFVVQSFCGFVGKQVFNVANAIVYIFFLYGCLRFLRISTFNGSIIAILAIWILLPIQFSFTHSISHAVNYLWVSAILVYYLIVLRHYLEKADRNSTLWKVCLCFLGGMVTGCTHEGFMLPLSASLFIYVCFYLRTFNRNVAALILGLWAGTAILVLSPANYHREISMALRPESLKELIWLKMNVIIYSKRTILLGALMLVGYYLWGKLFLIKFTKQHIILLLTIITGLLFIALVSFYAQRMVFPYELLSVLLCIIITKRARAWVTDLHAFSIVCMAILLVHTTIVIYYSHATAKEYDLMLKQYIESPTGETYYRYIQVPKFADSYIQRPGSFEFSMLNFEYGKSVIIK